MCEGGSVQNSVCEVFERACCGAGRSGAEQAEEDVSVSTTHVAWAPPGRPHHLPQMWLPVPCDPSWRHFLVRSASPAEASQLSTWRLLFWTRPGRLAQAWTSRCGMPAAQHFRATAASLSSGRTSAHTRASSCPRRRAVSYLTQTEESHQ